MNNSDPSDVRARAESVFLNRQPRGLESAVRRCHAETAEQMMEEKTDQFRAQRLARDVAVSTARP